MNGMALFMGTSRLHLSFANNRGLDFDILVRQTRIGIPASVTSAERSLAQVPCDAGLVGPGGEPRGTARVESRRLRDCLGHCRG